jgi:hypothetical protein
MTDKPQPNPPLPPKQKDVPAYPANPGPQPKQPDKRKPQWQPS